VFNLPFKIDLSFETGKSGLLRTFIKSFFINNSCSETTKNFEISSVEFTLKNVAKVSSFQFHSSLKYPRITEYGEASFSFHLKNTVCIPLSVSSFL
jgi:hypothetical protein